MKVRDLTTVAIAALCVVSSSAAVLAQDKMSGKKMGMQKSKMMSQGVYVCKPCKTYYSAMDAKKMKMMDPMGHKLVMMKKAPAGYKMMKMGEKMGDHKMMNKGKMKSGSGKM